MNINLEEKNHFMLVILCYANHFMPSRKIAKHAWFCVS